MLENWVFWMIAAVALAILEVLAPSFLFLGFAIGAMLVGLLIAFGGPISVLMTGSAPITVLVFAVASLISWIALRRLLGVRKGQVKIWDADINE